MRLYDDVARLAGSVTLPAFRRHGLYRALLRARCRIGADRNATLALTKARPGTSAPILERNGFTRYAEERYWRLPLTGP